MNIEFSDDPLKFLSQAEDAYGQPVAIRPCDKDCEGKTFLGFTLGSLPTGSYFVFENRDDDGERTGITVSPKTNPAVYVPALRRIVWGYESWWGPIESPEKLREITDETIGGQWYVKAAKALGIVPVPLDPPETKG